MPPFSFCVRHAEAGQFPPAVAAISAWRLWRWTVKPRVLLTAVVVTFPLMLCAQPQNAAPTNTLGVAPGSELSFQVTSAVRTQFIGPIFGRAGLDRQGNVYVRLHDPERLRNHTYFQAPIQEIGKDGSLLRSFRVTDVVPNAAGRGFSVTPDGTVYQLAQAGASVLFIAEFPDGHIGSATKLDVTSLRTTGFSPYLLAVFPTGGFLVSGITGAFGRGTLTAVFDANGKLKKEVVLTDDAEFTKRALAGDSELLFAGPNYGNAAVTRGEAVAHGANVYLMRSSASAVISVITAEGEVLHTLRVDSGDPGLLALSMKVGPDGTITVAFGPLGRTDNPQTVVHVVDSTGKSVETYRTNDLRITAFSMAGYDHDGFTFFKSESQGPGSIYRVGIK